MSETKIEWTEKTWNPTTGCTKISAGCTNCYAEKMARRLQAMGVPGYEKGFEHISVIPSRLEIPLGWAKPSWVFVNSMSDLFHPKVPFAYTDLVFETIRRSPQHTYQVLTKRGALMAEYFRSRQAPSNLWLGVTVENRKHGLPRIDYLREVEATVRFLSIEPLLESLGPLDLSGIHWVIVGGESGPRARPMKLEWVTEIRDQCVAANVPFFFKQWGTWGADGIKRSKKANGRLLSGKLWGQKP